jgi:hypothetical protein
VIGPAGGTANLQEIFAGIEEIRKRSRKQKGVTVKRLIAEGRA